MIVVWRIAPDRDIHTRVQELAKQEMRSTANMLKILVSEALFARQLAEGITMAKIFNANAVLLALNHHDPAVRLDRINALAGLVQDFQIELLFDGDDFRGLADVMPSSCAMAAEA
jgi:hypothetical protein